MTNISRTIIFVLCLILWPVMACGTENKNVILTGISADSGPAQTRIELDFSRIPAWSIRTLGQKLEIRLKDAAANANLGSLPEDESIVKTFLAKDRNDLVVSVLLRRMPTSAVATPDLKMHRLAIVIRWQSGDASRPAIVFDLPGLPGYRRIGSELKATGKFTSAWQGRWQDFLHSDHTPFHIVPTPAWTMPLLPPPKGLPKILESFWLESRWDDVVHGPSPELTFAEQMASLEALIRSGQFKEAESKLLVLEQLSSGKDKEALSRIDYLKAVLFAGSGRLFEARVILERLSQRMLPPLLADAIWILQVETSLAVRDANRALGFLEGRDPVEADLDQVAERRRADALALSGHKEEALAIYEKIAPIAQQFPFSLALYAQAAQATHRWEQARKAFVRLADSPLLDEQNRRLAKLAGLTLNRSREQIIERFDALQTIRWQRPGGEAALRAAMRLTDIMAPAKNAQGRAQQLATYDELATTAPDLDLRFEAGMKAAVLQYLSGENRDAVRRLETLLRQSSRGLLRNEAGALLTEILPQTIEDYLDDDQPLKALALVERHRTLLLQQHMSWDFLVRIARTFSDTSLHRRANRIFLFLYDRAKNPTHKGEAALAVAANFAEQELWEDARTYADRAAEHFKLDQNRHKAFLLQLTARMKTIPIEQTVAWLERHGIPETASALGLAANIYWQNERYDKVSELLKTKDAIQKLDATERLQLAEAAWRAGKLDLALEHYRRLTDNRQLGAQARYRIAGILLKQSQKDEAASLYRELAEKKSGGSRAWRDLARVRLRELTF